MKLRIFFTVIGILFSIMAFSQSASVIASALRPPAYPLITIDTYTNGWTFTDKLYDGSVKHWTGKDFPLTGAIKVDNIVYRFMGIDSTSLLTKIAVQQSVDVQATQTHYMFTCGNVNLQLTFSAPLFLDNLELLSRPVNYISYTVTSNDGKSHKVKLYFEAAPNWALDKPVQESTSESFQTGNLVFLKTGSKSQQILAKKGDDVRIDWGYFYMAADKTNSAGYVGSGKQLRTIFAGNGKINRMMKNKGENENGNLALIQDLGSTSNQNGRIMVGYDDIYSIQYFKTNLRPYWNRNNNETIISQFQKADKEYNSLIQKCNEFDKKLIQDATASGGRKYAELCALAYRQAIVAHKLAQAPNGDLLFMSKENFSNGSIGTVDVTYPSQPLFLYYNPELAKALLNHIFYYSESGQWTKPYPSHDVGTYPIANGQTYGGDMPVEESGNMLILTGAITKVMDDATYAQKHWKTMTTWVNYLVEKGLDPENQLCTDDFAGHFAHNANLSIKAIMGIASYAYMADMLGKKDTAAVYMEKAREMALKWVEMADDGDHYRLTFDKADTWSQKYNLVWDKILGFNLFPESVAEKEIAYYLTKQNKYGLPLDNRKTYTKTDWIIWTATMAKDKATFEKFIDPLYLFMNETVDRIPMSDWVFTDKPNHRGFQARSVVGGYFIKMLSDKLLSYQQQSISLENPKFKTGDNQQWKELSYDDSQWAAIDSKTNWERQGYPNYDGYAWYRFHFQLPSSLKDKSFLKDSLRIFLNRIDDQDDTYLNGQPIGKTSGWNRVREYRIPANAPYLKWDADNVIAVRVFDTSGDGGMFGGGTYIKMMDLVDGISMRFSPAGDELIFRNRLPKTVTGSLNLMVIDSETGKIHSSNTNMVLEKDKSQQIPVTVDKTKQQLLVATFTESKTKKTLQISQEPPYILTPPVSDLPKINSSKVFGVRPGSPVLYKIAATGEKPLKYAVKNLPKGLKVDAKTGIITGALTKKGDYQMTMNVKNAKGLAEKPLTIKVGDLLALTPPMGWNSWNCWGLSVSDQKVKSSAQAMVDKGLIDHGWTNINIDDGWEAPQRDAAGNIVSNEKFPDMKALGNWLHSKGLKFGIYSSPGTKTCGGFLGSYQHELQDATTYAKWGIDYLKYDWCSYSKIAGKDGSLAMLQKPYLIMRDALIKQPKDIVYSLCQYGMGNVWEWGDQVNGNCWRTTGDINDSWRSLSSIGFSQTVQYKYAKPGRWNDPDMLIVGQLGWGENLRPTNLTPDEQYTHISLWSLLSAPLLIGCDISKMDDFTLNLLTNDEVIAVNQDILGKQARQMVADNFHQVWMKELEDGSYAVGIFNMKDAFQTISLHWNEITLDNHKDKKIRDLWRQKDLGVFKDSFSTKVPPHGVTLIKISAND